MKIPSLNYILIEAQKSAKRFPLTLISAFIGTSIAVYLTEYEQDIENKFPFINLLLTSALGLVLFFCISIYKIKVERTKLPFWTLNVVGFFVLILIYFSLPGIEDTTNLHQPYIRYAIYNVVAHLLVSFAPFISKGEINGFWQYNKMLFLRFCLSILYSGFVYIGITLAFVALNLLFDADIKGETFFELFIIVMGIFNTWFFISGIDKNLNDLEDKTDYPKGLKIFTQYVLLPLLILYLVILYAYTIKIIGLWDWPEGIVSYLVVCVSVLGIFAFLLIYPFGKKDEGSWINKFSKAYYYTLIPLTIVLFFAIGIRIGDYGFTVNRYIIFELGLWLSFVSLYFIVGKKNIKIIPMSLACLIMLTSFGPWGMFSTAEKSQIDRLEAILTNNQILKNEKIVNEPVLELGKDSLFYLNDSSRNRLLLSDSLQNEVYSILNYLDDFHGYNGIDPWYEQNPDSVYQILKDSAKFYTYAGQPKVRMEMMGLEYNYNYGSSDRRSNYRTYNARKDLWSIMKTTGYDYVLTINHYDYSNEKENTHFTYGNDSFVFSKNESLIFSLEKSTEDALNFDLGKLLQDLQSKYKDKSSVVVEEGELILTDSVEHISGKLQIETIHANMTDNIRINSFMGKLYIKLH